MNSRHKENDLTEITDFDNKILMYAEIFGSCVIRKKGYVLQGLRTFLLIWQGLIISSYMERTYFEDFPSQISRNSLHLK